MKTYKITYTHFLFLVLGVCAVSSCSEKSIESRITPSTNVFKPIGMTNPVSSNIFCADPTGVEYEGRLYMYGTNDHEQFEKAERNTYEKIKSLVCFSTDDMVNWTFHGIINVGKIAPWIMNSWAPSITSRIEEDGLTHFYLYFSNSGCGVGSITSTSPLGPWKDILGKAVVAQFQPEIGDCPAPFDPGIVIDDKGTGWLAFGGGTAKTGTDEMPGVTRLARMAPDMIHTDTIVEIPAPYFFEASEMNFMNGVYVYTLNNNWKRRNPDTWTHNTPLPAQCSMAYMTTTTPLDPSSWKYRGHYFLNPGEAGLEWSNNHTHFMKYQGQYYIMNHSMILQEPAGTHGGFRSLMVDSLRVDENSLTIELTKTSRKGVGQIKSFNPFVKVPATTMITSSDIWYIDMESAENIQVVSNAPGAWLSVAGVDFGRGARKFIAQTCGKGRVEVHIDAPDGPTVAALDCDTREEVVSKTRLAGKLKGIHDLYLLFSDKDMSMKYWMFE